MARKVGTTAAARIEHGEVALMLCEAILHVLVERSLLTRDDVIEVLDCVSDIIAETRERPPAARRGSRAMKPLKIIEAMRASFELK